MICATTIAKLIFTFVLFCCCWGFPDLRDVGEKSVSSMTSWGGGFPVRMQSGTRKEKKEWTLNVWGVNRQTRKHVIVGNVGKQCILPSRETLGNTWQTGFQKFPAMLLTFCAQRAIDGSLCSQYESHSRGVTERRLCDMENSRSPLQPHAVTWYQ